MSDKGYLVCATFKFSLRAFIYNKVQNIKHMNHNNLGSEW